jgi:hypothetical protein
MSEDISKEPLPPSRRELPRESSHDPAQDYKEEPPYPQLLRTAGVIWIVFGCLVLLSTAFMVRTIASGLEPRDPRGVVGGMVCIMFLSALWAAAFYYIGKQSIRGTARDTLVQAQAAFCVSGSWGSQW